MKVKITRILIFFVFFVFFSDAIGATEITGNLIIERQENNGRMNIIPCHVYILKDSKVQKGLLPKVLDLSNNNQANRILADSILLVGGDIGYYSLKPGKYEIYIETPIKDQGRYIEPEHVWKSEKFVVTLSDNNSAHVYVIPSSSGSYSGGWIVSFTPENE